MKQTELRRRHTSRASPTNLVKLHNCSRCGLEDPVTSCLLMAVSHSPNESLHCCQGSHESRKKIYTINGGKNHQELWKKVCKLIAKMAMSTVSSINIKMASKCLILNEQSKKTQHTGHTKPVQLPNLCSVGKCILQII